MKVIIISILKSIYWMFVIIFGALYSLLYFFYDPKAIIKEKKENLSYWGGNRGIDWKETLLTVNFWCPFIES